MALKEVSAVKAETPAKPSTHAIPEKIVTLAGKFKDAFQITPTGVVEVKPELYASTLPKGLSMEQVLAVHHHDRDVVAATRLANGELAIPFLAKHPKIDQVAVEFAGGLNTFGEVFNREKQVPDGKGGMQTKIGHTRSFFDAGADSDKSTLNRINTHLASLSSDLLKPGKK